MTSRVLPTRPNLEQLKKQAKALLGDARSGDRAALERFSALAALVRDAQLTHREPSNPEP